MTQEIAKKFGADGFAEDAIKAQKEAIKLLSALKGNKEGADPA